MADTDISNAAAKAATDAVVDLLDAGSGAGYIEIRTGTKPTGGPDATAAGSVLVTMPLDDPAFGNAADTNPGARATAAGLPNTATASGTGTATWARGYDSNGVAVIDGDVGLTGSGAAFILDNTSIVSGQLVQLNSWTVDHPEG